VTARRSPLFGVAARAGLLAQVLLLALPLLLASLPVEARASEVGLAASVGEFHAVALHSLDRRAQPGPVLPPFADEVPAPNAPPELAPEAADGPPPAPVSHHGPPPETDPARGARLLR
jgi:hypothetical protein